MCRIDSPTSPSIRSQVRVSGWIVEHDRRVRERLRFSKHARDRLLNADLNVLDVELALSSAETIEKYDDGSRLVLGRADIRPLHIVLREDDEAGRVFVITVYEPDPTTWDASFRKRRRR